MKLVINADPVVLLALSALIFFRAADCGEDGPVSYYRLILTFAGAWSAFAAIWITLKGEA